MKEFLNQNEGLRSRIAFHLNFPDYTAKELTEMMELMSKNREYHLEDKAKEYCMEIFEEAVKEENFGNGRFARNILEQAILRQSNRIVSMPAGEKISKEEICLLTRNDFKMPEFKERKKKENRMGFIYCN